MGLEECNLLDTLDGLVAYGEETQFVATPELHSDEAIDGDPLPPGQVWAVGPGSGEAGAGAKA